MGPRVTPYPEMQEKARLRPENRSPRKGGQVQSWSSYTPAIAPSSGAGPLSAPITLISVIGWCSARWSRGFAPRASWSPRSPTSLPPRCRRVLPPRRRRGEKRGPPCLPPEEDWEPCYLRYSELPPGRASQNFETGEYEQGCSVFKAGFAGLCRLCTTSRFCTGFAPRPKYYVSFWFKCDL